ncbi:Conserved hypothetical protein 2001 [Alloalcanivorax xenomutans]|jgi:uncharacterized protein (TIGR02001 family)|uniref:TorF family putative porin n=1 Tax=Alloalcanivorax xenomutans TaxID=1094342 RepID=UPI0006D5BFE9|nr:TorF family putative porin [Alloalcanivorax xenomutans]PHS71909.1 MAG: hypothetical protein COB00_02300 [Alcanivorax sp.]CUR47052.1 Conserved hypothetical protein 2001 [Alloalcanivorax xenomutans]
MKPAYVAPVSLFMCTLAVPASADWQTDANVTLTSNYLWRGKTQSDDRPALQAGIETRHTGGGYAGAWFSTIDNGEDAGYEADFTTGWRFQAGPVPVDTGLIYYAYPIAEQNSDVGESFITLGPDALQIRYALTVWKEDRDGDTHDQYLALGGDYPLGDDYGFSWTLGHMENATDSDGNYQHLALGLSRDLAERGVLSLGAESNNADDDRHRNRPRLVLSWQWNL